MAVYQGQTYLRIAKAGNDGGTAKFVLPLIAAAISILLSSSHLCAESGTRFSYYAMWP